MIAGGAERVLVNLVNALPEEEYDITLCSMFSRSVYPGYDAVLNDSVASSVKCKTLFDNSTALKSRFWNMVLNRVPSRWLHKLFVGGGYDCEVAFYEGRPTTFLAHSSNRRSRKIAWLHTTTELSMPDDASLPAMRKAYGCYDRIVAVSGASKDSFVRRLGFGDKVEVIYNLIDYRRVLRLSECPPDAPMLRGKVTFVSVGRLTAVKGYDRLLRVARTLRDEGYDFALNIIGAGEEHARLSKYIETHGLQDQVALLGHMQNPYPYVRRADCFVCSSMTEGYPLALAEALILKRPIVSVELPALNDVLGRYADAAVKGGNSESGLTEAMKKVLDCPAVLAAARTVAESFDAGDAYNAIIDEVEKVL